MNELLYVPYKVRYEKKIITYANDNNGKIDNLFCTPPKVNNMIKMKNGSYCMVDQLTLGEMAYFCIDMKYNPEKKDLVRFVRETFNNVNFNVDKLVSFGKEIMEVSKRRNHAAHASENLPAESFIESKDYVFNKELSVELRNMLWRFLELFQL